MIAPVGINPDASLQLAKVFGVDAAVDAFFNDPNSSAANSAGSDVADAINAVITELNTAIDTTFQGFSVLLEGALGHLEAEAIWPEAPVRRIFWCSSMAASVAKQACNRVHWRIGKRYAVPPPRQ